MHDKPVTADPMNLTTDEKPRWCPGCGNYAVLAQLRKLLPTLGIPRENFVFISGIGCSSRLPYYINTYGMHTIHGRAPTIATGLKCARPELSIWVITGDGDGLSIGGNHFIHAIRRNIDIKILLFNNRIYGLTKGQYSPTSELGKRTKSTPCGTIERPLGTVSLALGAAATFVGRAIDTDAVHLAGVLERAARHRGTAVVEIYQDCNVFNPGGFTCAADKEAWEERIVYLEHGRPLVFGRNRDKGIRLNGLVPEIVAIGGDAREDDLLIHDEKAPSPATAFILSQMQYPETPEPMGVFRCVERPCYDELMREQVRTAVDRQGKADLAELFHSGDTWVVE